MVRLAGLKVGVVGLAKVKSSSSGSTKKGVEVERGSMAVSVAGILKAKLELEVPGKITETLKSGPKNAKLSFKLNPFVRFTNGSGNKKETKKACILDVTTV